MKAQDESNVAAVATRAPTRAQAFKNAAGGSACLRLLRLVLISVLSRAVSWR
jgi:hypothetical protein